MKVVVVVDGGDVAHDESGSKGMWVWRAAGRGWGMRARLDGVYREIWLARGWCCELRERERQNGCPGWKLGRKSAVSYVEWGAAVGKQIWTQAV